jgi:SpoVK/Ycf46/Vps4 family AAA+-type ATPase
MGCCSGRGIIMLLEGSPGVGKTLTAEATAEELSRPLYVVSGGELGTHAHGVEAALEMILHVAAKWDAVLLLDECDVFLEKRDLHDLARNGTVAVFLRLLEYFSGVLFMTTNRVEIIDPAFDSRIHLSIRYPKLSQEARQRVWKTFLAANCPDSRLGENEVKEMAKLDLNGREIKNLIKTAHLWATHEEEPLDINHCRSILKVTKRGGLEN